MPSPRNAVTLLLSAAVALTASTRIRAQVPIVCDTSFEGAIQAPLERDFYDFSAMDGEIVSVNVVEFPAGQAFAPIWRLLDSLGAPAPSCGTFRGARSDCGPLPASGSPYRIEVADSGNNDTGTYVVRFQRLSSFAACDELSLFCSIPVDGSIEQIGDSDLLRFNVPTDDERLEINVVEVPPGQTFTPVWRLLAASGAPAASCGTFRGGISDCGPLPTAGNPYRVEVAGNSTATGTYRVSLVQLTTPCDEGPEGQVPLCELQLNQTSYQNAEVVTASVFRVANIGTEAAKIEVSVWLEIPSLPPQSIAKFGANGSVTLPPGFDVDAGPLSLFTVTAAFPRGDYALSCRVIDPVTLRLLAEDLNPFAVP